MLLAGVSVIAVVSGVPAFAQSHAVRVRDEQTIAHADPDRTSAGILRPYTPSEPAAPATLEIPGNLTVSDVHRPLLESMLRASPTFRRQCARVAAARELSVSIRNSHQPVAPSARARTVFTAGASNRLVAVVELIATADIIELVAHEIEHIIEQLDGIDLHAHAAQATSGVRHCEGGAFETTRAIRAGRAVAEEVRRGGR